MGAGGAGGAARAPVSVRMAALPGVCMIAGLLFPVCISVSLAGVPYLHMHAAATLGAVRAHLAFEPGCMRER